MQHDINRSRSTRTMAGALAGLSAAVAVHAQNRIVYVDASAPAGGNGQSWQTAYNDLQVALLLTERSDYAYIPAEFRIAAGTYRSDLGLGYRDLPFNVTQGDKLVGGFAGRAGLDPDATHPHLLPTILSGDLGQDDSSDPVSRSENARSLVRVAQGSRLWPLIDSISTDFRNLTFTGIDSDENSGVVLRCSGPAQLTFCNVVGNRCNSILTGSSFKLIGCNVDGNQAVVVMSLVELMANCRVRGNIGHPNFSLIRMSTSAGSSSISGCLIANNSGCYTLLEYIENLQLHRTTIAHNAMERYLMLTYSPNVRISNCIIAGNSQAIVRPILVGCSAAVLSGPNIFGNGPDDISPPSYSTPCNYGVVPITDARPFVNPNGPDHNPRTWADNDYRPRLGGPSIDAANLSVVPGNLNLGDADSAAPFDIQSAVNTGVGSSTFADIGGLEHIPRATEAPCPADFNASGSVTVQDVFDFLSAFFSGCS